MENELDKIIASIPSNYRFTGIISIILSIFIFVLIDIYTVNKVSYTGAYHFVVNQTDTSIILDSSSALLNKKFQKIQMKEGKCFFSSNINEFKAMDGKIYVRIDYTSHSKQNCFGSERGKGVSIILEETTFVVKIYESIRNLMLS